MRLIHQHGHVDPLMHPQSAASGLTELLIVDEADRLKTTGLELVRDYYDRHHMGVILIGMPGIERRLARYPQLYSRIGFAHEYRPLNPDELTVVLTRRWHADGLATASGPAPGDDSTQTVAIATSPASPAATSASSTDCSPRSSASERSTTSRPSPPRSSKPPAKRCSSVPDEPVPGHTTLQDGGQIALRFTVIDVAKPSGRSRSGTLDALQTCRTCQDRGIARFCYTVSYVAEMVICGTCTEGCPPVGHRPSPLVPRQADGRIRAR